ncbi:MAG: hypothetical protein CVU63_05790, partial [Deltaproteobacteria bacterium HGW-Deltaproteobacteria-20]
MKVPVRQETVLVVEDEPTLRMGLRATLRSEGFKVLVASTGPEGLEMALDQSPDLLLLDVMLPGMNGFEILRALRERRPDLPIILLTAKGEEQDKVQGLRLGADATGFVRWRAGGSWGVLRKLPDGR